MFDYIFKKRRLKKKLKLQRAIYEYAYELTCMDWQRHERNPWEIRAKIREILEEKE